MPNGAGVVLTSGVTGNVIGGAAAGAGNLISGNSTGIQSTGGGANVIQGNLIGTSITGNSPVSNGRGHRPDEHDGLRHRRSRIRARATSSRETPTRASSVIIGSGCRIQGNRIGTNAAGTESIPNQWGIYATSHADLVIGGDFDAGEGNLISGNQIDGIYSASVGSVVTGNTIGTDPTRRSRSATAARASISPRRRRTRSSAGRGAGEANAIAWNQSGVYNNGPRNAIRANPIFFNQRLGIDNSPDGVTKNDAGDGDTGSNLLQNFPLISSVDYGATNLTVHGILKSTPNTTFDIDVFESPSCTPRPRQLLQSAYYLGSTQITTDGAGDAPFDIVVNDANAPTASADLVDGDGSLGQHLGVLAEGHLRVQPALGTAGGRRDREPDGDPLRRGRNGHLRRRGGLEPFRDGRDHDDRHGPAFCPPRRSTTSRSRTRTARPASSRKPGSWTSWTSRRRQQFYDFVTTLVSNAITVGVGSGLYGVNDPTLRQQMAVFLLKGRHGICYVPPDCTGTFSDVPCPSTFANWIEALAAEGITGGCGAGIYCPQNPVRRDQMAVFPAEGQARPELHAASVQR